MKLDLKRPIAFFDLETTGLNTEKDRIVEIAISKLNPDGSTQAYKARIDPEIPIPEEAIAVHGITNEMVSGCPTWEQIGPKIYEEFEGCDVGGYNSNNFDVPFLFNCFLRIGKYWDYTEFAMIDVQKIYYQKERRRLADAVRLYLGKEMEGWHDALNDINYTVEVFLAQLEKYDDLPDNVNELALFCNGGRKIADLSGKLVYDENGQLLYNFGKNLGKEVTSDVSYASWMLSSNFPADTKNVLLTYLTEKSENHGRH